jgi:hypothetical protein
MLLVATGKQVMAQSGRADCACSACTRENGMPLNQFASASNHALGTTRQGVSAALNQAAEFAEYTALYDVHAGLN